MKSRTELRAVRLALLLIILIEGPMCDPAGLEAAVCVLKPVLLSTSNSHAKQLNVICVKNFNVFKTRTFKSPRFVSEK